MTALGKEQKLRDLLQQKLEQLRPMYSRGLPGLPNQYSESLIWWQNQVEVILRSYFGAESPQLKQFKEAISLGPNSRIAPDPFVVKAESALEAILLELKISKELQPARKETTVQKVWRWFKEIIEIWNKVKP